MDLKVKIIEDPNWTEEYKLKLQAVKTVKNQFNLGLKEAKDIVKGKEFHIHKSEFEELNDALKAYGYTLDKVVNDDEKIKNRLINLVKMSNEAGGFALHKWEADEMLTWLEKQQKSTWSEEDIYMIDWLIRCCEEEHKELCNDKYGHQEIVSDLKRDCRKKWDWLGSLKNRVAPQNTVKEVKEKLLLQKAISVYGAIAQTDMAIEEMGELIVAINHYRRGRIEMDAVKEEIADVIIAMKQLAIIYGESGVEIFSEKKMQRLEQRLKDR